MVFIIRFVYFHCNCFFIISAFKLLKYHICSIIKYFNKWGWFFDSKRRKINRGILTQYDKR